MIFYKGCTVYNLCTFSVTPRAALLRLRELPREREMFRNGCQNSKTAITWQAIG